MALPTAGVRPGLPVEDGIAGFGCGIDRPRRGTAYAGHSRQNHHYGLRVFRQPDCLDDAVYFAGSFFYPLRGVQLLLYPCAALMLLSGLVFPGKFSGYEITDLPFMLHIGTSLLAYGLFGIATLLSVLTLLLNRSLHRRSFSKLAGFLPSLLSLEKLMFQAMWAGFILLTYSVVSGTFFAEAVFGKPMTFTHKTVFGILSWLIYGGLLLKHSMTAWRGKKAAVWTIIGFVSLMIAYMGSKFVLEIILKR